MSVKIQPAIAALATAVSCLAPALAYEVRTHEQFALVAANASILSNGETLRRLGLQPSSWNGKPIFPNSRGAARTILQLVGDGAIAEDDGIRALNHFFDPILDAGLLYTSPRWALEEPATALLQNWSLRDGREYLFQALTNTDPVERARYWGRTFETLGRVVHHVQDMAQPQHVRMDVHLNLEETLQKWGIEKELFFEHRSRYERYSNDPQVLSLLVPLMRSGAAPTSFVRARDYWTNAQGTGIAEYTNRNFVSQGTNFLLLNGSPAPSWRYDNPVPSPTPTEVVPIRALLAAKGKGVPPGVATACPLETDCNVLFFGTAVSGRASSLSIFDEDLKATGRTVTYVNPDTGQSYQVDSLFALNEFNFDAAHVLLVPKATSYTTGLINHFFRGAMKIGLPSQGVYAIVDHVAPAGTDPQAVGFAKVKARVQNVTSSGVDASGNPVIEPMTGGTLHAVAKFHRNTCYRLDLSGEYGAGNDWRQCRREQEEIVVSGPAALPAAINAEGGDVQFVFPTPIPASATDLFLQVIYRGPLGQEAEAVVVETKDISEPTYGFNVTRWDQYTFAFPWPVVEIPGPLTYAQWCAGGFSSIEDCNQAMGLTAKTAWSPTSAPIPNYDPQGVNPGEQGTTLDIALELPFSPVVVSTAPIGTMTRVAWLADASPANAALDVLEQIDATRDRGIFQWFTGTARSTIVQRDPATDSLIPSVTYRRSRLNAADLQPLFVPDSLAELLLSGAADPFPTLTLKTSTIDF